MTHLRRTLILTASALTFAALACSAGGWLPGAEETPVPTEQAANPVLIPSNTPSPIPLIQETSTATPIPVVETETPTVFPTATGPRPSPSPFHFQVFDEVWGTINAHYLYRDFNGLDWNSVREENLQRIGAGLTDPEFYAMLAEMVRKLGDDHSTFFDPEQARQLDAEFAGEYEYVGIGVIHTPMPELGLLTIVLVFPGSPAEQAGLQPHDSILAVDGVSIFDEQGNRRNLLRGPDGSTITVTIQTPGQAIREVTLQRAPVSGEMPVPSQILFTPSGKRIGYLLIPTFNEGTVDEKVGQAIQQMSSEAPLDGLIIDNRHNGGGSSEVMLNTLKYFVNGDVGQFIQRDLNEDIRVEGVDIAGSQSLPLAVLVGDATASFGEVFAGILKDLGRAMIIGEQTSGNVELMRVYDFSDGSRAWIASATFRPLNHPEQDWEETGILPDILSASNWNEVTNETDPVIQEALRFFGG